MNHSRKHESSTFSTTHTHTQPVAQSQAILTHTQPVAQNQAILTHTATQSQPVAQSQAAQRTNTQKSTQLSPPSESIQHQLHFTQHNSTYCNPRDYLYTCNYHTIGSHSQTNPNTMYISFSNSIYNLIILFNHLR